MKDESRLANQEKTIEVLRKQVKFQAEAMAHLTSRDQSGAAGGPAGGAGERFPQRFPPPLEVNSIRLFDELPGRPDDNQRVFMSTQRVEELPSSSVWCQGAHPADRICRFRNFCYLPDRDKFVFTRGPRSTIVMPREEKEESRLLDLTSLDGHSAFKFDYEEVDQAFFKGKRASFVPGKTFAFSRFHPYNIMHVIHDDILGLYFLLKEFANGSPQSQEHGIPSDSVPFSLDHNILLLDGHEMGTFGHILTLFSQKFAVFPSHCLLFCLRY